VQAQTLQEGQQAGYVVPPSTINPSFLNNRLESLAGKAAVGQEAAKRNQGVTNALIAQELGLEKGTPLSEATLERVRHQAAAPYREVASMSPAAATKLEELKAARFSANEQFKYYNRSGNPEAGEKARAMLAKANALERDIETIASGGTKAVPAQPITPPGKAEVPRSALPPEGNMEMLLRAEKAQADIEIAGKERGAKIFQEQMGHGSTPDVIGLKSATADWYKELTKGEGKLSRKQVESAIAKIIKDEGSDKGVTVERVKEVLLRDHEFHQIVAGDVPSWIEMPPGQPAQAVAQRLGREDLVEALRASRTKIAKTYDVERSLNLGSGDIAAPILGRQLDKSGLAAKSGRLATIGRMAEAFPSVMREGARVPSPGVSGTDAAAGAILGTLGYGAGGPAGLLAAGLPLLRGPARNLVLSPGFQKFATADPARFQAIIDALSQQGAGLAGTATGRGGS
jgi:hypothetical protein